MKTICNVVCVTDYFLPGYLGGGPIRTLDNMRTQLAGQVTLAVFTRDRDLGAQAPYPDIATNEWVETPDGPVFYACPRTFGPKGFREALAARTFDAIYLNSFFSPRASILLYLDLLWRGFRLPILLAPRGEFSSGALAVKPRRKKLFLKMSRVFGLYKDLYWHASTQIEASHILRQFPESKSRIHVAPDPILIDATEETAPGSLKVQGNLKIAFISRISPKKNLDGLLKVLSSVEASIELNIFGPVEDEAYWRRCEAIIASLPSNIRVKPHGAVAPDEVSATFARHDLFAFPTHGENFGHVIFEALRAGTPVLISDQTPWHADEAGAVTDVPLSDTATWCNAIERAAGRTAGEQEKVRRATLDYAVRYASEVGSLEANLEMFRALVSSHEQVQKTISKT